MPARSLPTQALEGTQRGFRFGGACSEKVGYRFWFPVFFSSDSKLVQNTDHMFGGDKKENLY